MICGDNISECHNPIIVGEDSNAMVVKCNHCWAMQVIRKNPHKSPPSPENRSYSKFFKKDILQGGENLLYKYHPELIRQ